MLEIKRVSVNWAYFKMRTFLLAWPTGNLHQVGSCVFWWRNICLHFMHELAKKHAAVSHSIIEADVISTSLTLVFKNGRMTNTQNVSPSMPRHNSPWTVTTPFVAPITKSFTENIHVFFIDHVPPNAPQFSNKAQPFIDEDSDKVIKMVMKAEPPHATCFKNTTCGSRLVVWENQSVFSMWTRSIKIAGILTKGCFTEDKMELTFRQKSRHLAALYESLGYSCRLRRACLKLSPLRHSEHCAKNHIVSAFETIAKKE